MCGIAGLYAPAMRGSETGLAHMVRAMSESIAHRGPDGSGHWVDADAGLAVAHRRLAIIDLSDHAAQPMVSASGNSVLTFNGEIYNYRELRRDLESAGVCFRTASDTEVVLEGCEHWGIAETARRLNGMFAFALWDRRNRRLTLVRDRVGIKPLYWMPWQKGFAFASEPRALATLPGFSTELDQAALTAYFRLSYVPAPYSVWRNVRKLEPGTLMSIAPDGSQAHERYWDLHDIMASARPTSDSMQDAISRLDGLLTDAVRGCMIADVPLGAFLSGGIDSSTVVAIMQKLASAPVRTFSIGFDGSMGGYNEAGAAAAVARHLGTEHTELIVTSSDALSVIGRIADIYDEPFADSSQIPTYLVSTMTRRSVTVALSGDGGDEAFAGYNRYLTPDVLRNFGAIPMALRKMIAQGITAVPPHTWDRMAMALPSQIRMPQTGEKLHKIADALCTSDPLVLYRLLVSQWPGGSAPSLSKSEPPEIAAHVARAAEISDPVRQLQYLDVMTYLPDDVLTKLDRASMAVALESRVPLLDHRVVEFGLSLPPNLRRAGSRGKYLLRRVLNTYVPETLTDRPKTGFAVPIGDWLRGPMRDWAENLLNERRIEARGLLDAKAVRATWSDHLSGRANRQHALWTVLMFESWADRWLGAAPA